MTTVSECHTISIQTCSNTDDLVAHANTKHRSVPLRQGLAEVQGSLHAMVRIAGAVAEEQPIVLVANLIEVEIPRKDGNGSTAADERTENVCLRAEVEHRNLHIAAGVEVIRSLCRDLVDEVLGSRVPILSGSGSRLRDVGAYGKTAERGTLITEEARDGPSIDTSDARNAEALAPICQ